MSSLRDLEEEKERSLAALVSLEKDWAAGEIDDVSYRELRDDYTGRAAGAIRALESAPPDARPAPTSPLPPTSPSAARTTAARTTAGPPAGRPGRVRVRRRWMLAGSILAFAVAAGILVGGLAVARKPGQQISGNPPVTAQQPKGTMTVQVAAELLQARTLVSQGSDVAAAKILAKVLAADPTQPIALAYEGWVVRLAGVSAHNPADVAQGRALVAEAAALDPSYPDAHVFLGYMYYQDSNNATAAVTQFRDFLSDHPLAVLVSRTAPVMAQAFAAAHQALPRQVAADLSKTAH